MDFHNHFPFGTLSERDRLDVRIDHRPLTCPVTAHFVTSVYMTAFHPICPNDILVHGCEHGLHIARLEAVVNAFKEVHFVRHSNFLRHGPRWRKPHFPTPSSFRISDLCFARLGAATFTWATERSVGNPSLTGLRKGCP